MIRLQQPDLRICLTGAWLSSENVGDHAIFQGITDSFAAFGRPQYSVLTANPKKVEAQYGVTAFAPRQTPLRLIRNLMQADALVYTGGTPFFDLKPHMAYFTSLAAIARARRIPVIVMGVTLRSLKSGFSRAMMRRIAAWADYLGARERRTFDAFEHFSPQRSKVHLVPDAATQMRPSQADRAGKLLAEDGVDLKARNLLISLRDFTATPSFERIHYSRRYGPAVLKQYYHAIRQMAEHAVRKHDCHVLFYPMHTIDPNDDRPLARQIREAVSDPGVRRRINVIERQYSPRDTKAAMGCMHAVVGVRFHALVLGTSMHVPALGVCYARKSQEFMSYIGQDRHGVDLAEIDAATLCKRLDRVLDRRDEIAGQLKRRYVEINAEFRRQLQTVGQLLRAARRG